MLLPAALRLACHIRFMARPPSWMASEEPVVAVPMASFDEGAFHIDASIDIPEGCVRLNVFLSESHSLTSSVNNIWCAMRCQCQQRRRWRIKLTCGGVFIGILRLRMSWWHRRPDIYIGDLPMRFLFTFSWKSWFAWGGIQVLTKDARFKIVEPSGLKLVQVCNVYSGFLLTYQGSIHQW